MREIDREKGARMSRKMKKQSLNGGADVLGAFADDI